MTQAVRRKDVAETVHEELGTVVVAEESGLHVRTADGVVKARRAVSCLVEPLPGDLVLIAVPGARDAYVLAVLERHAERDQGVTIAVQGPLTIETADRIDLRGKEGVAVETKRFDLRAGGAKLALGALELVARAADVKLEVAKVFSDAIDVLGDRVLTQVKRSYRFVEELDVTRAKDVDVRAEQTVQVRGRNALVSAEQLYKVDAEQIHLG